METGYLLALTTGLVGGFGHCIGMCGPIVASYTLSQPARSGPLSDRVTTQALYNGGRITTYTLLGGLMGFSGSFVNVAGRLAGLQNLVAVIAGAMMVLMGLSIAGRGGHTAWLERRNAPVLRTARGMLASPSRLRSYPLGLVLGLIPCGLSYTAFIAAAGTGGALSGMLTALLFGVGTLPALLAFGTVISSFSALLRDKIYRTGGVLVIVMGIYYLYQGISLYARM